MGAAPELATRLRALAALAEQTALPDTTVRRLELACGLAERDHHILAASIAAGGTTALLEVLDNHGWRLPVWRSRGRCPEVANPVLAALFEAGDLPCARQIQRILRHPVSGATD